MAEGVLHSAIEGKIPFSDVRSWILNENESTFSSNNFSCSREEFVLFTLNFLRQSAGRILLSSVSSSPIKSVSKNKSTPVDQRSSVDRSFSRHRNNGRQNSRRAELFPTTHSASWSENEGDRNSSIKSLEEPKQNVSASAEHFVNDLTGDGRVGASSIDHPRRPVLHRMTPSPSPGGRKEAEKWPLQTPELCLPITSSPCASSVTCDGSPQFTPIHKFHKTFKFAERSSPPSSAGSPEHFSSRTPNRTSGVCLGDFIMKSGKGPRNSQQKKRISASPQDSKGLDSGSPILSRNDLSDDSQFSKKKLKRRINPTKVVVGDENPRQTGFVENPFRSPSRPVPEASPFQDLGNIEPSDLSHSYAEERNLLKQERLKLQCQSDCTPLSATPTKAISAVAKTVTPTRSTRIVPAVLPDPIQVTFKDHLLRLCNVYCTLLDANLVPNLMSELYFIISLLVAHCRASGANDDSGDIGIDQLSICGEEKISAIPTPALDDCLDDASLDGSKYFRSIHNCVFFASRVLWNQKAVLGCLDRVTLKLLLENARISEFIPELTRFLATLYSKASKARNVPGTVSVSTAFKAMLTGNVSFQSETDNSSNFPSAQSFSNFRKQRDGFYELIRIWEANHMIPGWNFSIALGSRVRSLLYMCSDPVNYVHLSRLFRLQLIATISGDPTGSDEEGEDLQFLQCLGVDADKLNRLRERLVAPHKTAGPRPAPSFPGLQEFFRDFILVASNMIFTQHLQDSFISHLMELDQTPFMASDMEDTETSVDEATRHSYLSCVSTMRLLAKFLGLLVFLPYQRPETRLPESIFETEVSIRSKVAPPINILACVVKAYQTRRLVITLPWVVKFLGMMDVVSVGLPYYRTVLRTLFRIYVNLMRGGKGRGVVMHAQSMLMLRLCLGWLFDSPVLPEGIFTTWCFIKDDLESLLNSTELHILSKQGVAQGDLSFSDLNASTVTAVTSNVALSADSLDVVSQEALYSLCPFLTELRALLVAVPGTGVAAGAGGPPRHITPVSASFTQPSPSTSARQLELQLEECFFHGLPASVHKTVEFVVERVTSSCVKHICNVWLPGIKEQGMQDLQNIITKSLKNGNKTNSLQKRLLKEAHRIVEQVSADLRSKCRSGAGDFCASKCSGALMALLSEDSLSPAVCQMCVAIATRLSTERVILWMQTHATLSMYSKDLQSEVDKALKQKERSETVAMAKTSHIAPGHNALWEHDDAVPSPAYTLQVLKLLVCDIMDRRGGNINEDYVYDVLDKVERTVTKRQDVIPAAERILATLTADLIISLVCHYPSMVNSDLIKRMIHLWKLDALRPVEDGLSRLVCPRNMLLLAQSAHPARFVWEKLADVVAAVLTADLVTAELVEHQCLAIMQQEWPQSILRNFSLCMNEVVRQYTKQKDVEYKFVLLLEWLAETMMQMDHFPAL